jgi:hypothetical protein
MVDVTPTSTSVTPPPIRARADPLAVGRIPVSSETARRSSTRRPSDRIPAAAPATTYAFSPSDKCSMTVQLPVAQPQSLPQGERVYLAEFVRRTISPDNRIHQVGGPHADSTRLPSVSPPHQSRRIGVTLAIVSAQIGSKSGGLDGERLWVDVFTTQGLYPVVVGRSRAKEVEEVLSTQNLFDEAFGAILEVLKCHRR